MAKCKKSPSYREGAHDFNPTNEKGFFGGYKHKCSYCGETGSCSKDHNPGWATIAGSDPICPPNYRCSTCGRDMDD